MDDILQMIADRILQLEKEYEEIVKQIKPLERRKNIIEEKLNTIKHYLSLEEQTKGATGKLAGKSPKEAYEEVIKTDFRDKTFKEAELREYATNEGSRNKNGKPIASSYSRLLIANLVRNGLLEKPERGLYRAKIRKLERVRSPLD